MATKPGKGVTASDRCEHDEALRSRIAAMEAGDQVRIVACNDLDSADAKVKNGTLMYLGDGFEVDYDDGSKSEYDEKEGSERNFWN